MKNPHIVDRTPPPQFADRLEVEFLRAAGAAATALSTRADIPEEPIMTIDLDTPPTTQQPRVASWKLFALTAAAVVLIVGIAAVLVRRDDTTPAQTGTPVSFTVEWEHTDKTTMCAEKSVQTCLNQFSLPAGSTFVGDLAGVASQAVFWNGAGPVDGEQRNHVDHAAVYGFDGAVSPCGTDAGQFMVVETIRWVSGEGFDGQTGTYTGTWQIVDDSGRNGLKGIAGSGESHSALGSDARTFSGTITCPTS